MDHLDVQAVSGGALSVAGWSAHGRTGLGVAAVTIEVEGLPMILTTLENGWFSGWWPVEFGAAPQLNGEGSETFAAVRDPGPRRVRKRDRRGVQVRRTVSPADARRGGAAQASRRSWSLPTASTECKDESDEPETERRHDQGNACPDKWVAAPRTSPTVRPGPRGRRPKRK